jgi:hypothetical protein
MSSGIPPDGIASVAEVRDVASDADAELAQEPAADRRRATAVVSRADALENVARVIAMYGGAGEVGVTGPHARDRARAERRGRRRARGS